MVVLVLFYEGRLCFYIECIVVCCFDGYFLGVYMCGVYYKGNLIESFEEVEVIFVELW